MPDNEQNIINRESFGGSDIRRVRTHYQGQAQNFCKMKNEVNRALVAKKTKEFYGYPREGFTPETRELSNSTIVAHAAQTPFWLTQSGLVFALTKDGAWKRRTVSGLKGHPAYGRRQANGCHSGERYPHLGHARKNYAAHKLMALAWLGPIPAGWEVDHINGNILDWTLQNIQIVSVAENRKRAVILRARRMVARQDNDPSKDPKNMSSEELLQLFNMYNVAGDVYAGE